MSIEIWIGFLAFVLMMLGAGVSIHPPERRELKIALFCAFGVTGVSLLVLTFVQAGDRSSEQRQAAAAQLRLQESADQNRQELGKVKSQLGEIQKIASQPGSPDERLDSALEGISKVLGQKSVTGFSRSSPASPVAPLSFLREIPLKGGPAQRLDLIMRAAGYTGPTDMSVLTVYNREDNPNEVDIGMQPDLNPKNSRRLDAGSYDNFQGGEDTSRIWLHSLKDGKIDVDFRPR